MLNVQKESKYTTRSRGPHQELSLTNTRTSGKRKATPTKKSALKQSGTSSDEGPFEEKSVNPRIHVPKESDPVNQVTFFVKDKTTKVASTVSMKKTVRRFLHKPIQFKPKTKAKKPRRPYWLDEEIYNLIQASIERSEETRPYFKGEYGMNDVGNDAWDYVASKYPIVYFCFLPFTL